jgi:cell division control protein 6
MGFFNNNLASAQSLFKNELALDFDFVPKLIPFREPEQRQFAACIQPLLQSRNGRNMFIYGPPGIGKTAALRVVLRELEDQTEEVIPIYINCWQKNTSFKIVLEVCDQLGYTLTHNKRTEELFSIVTNIINKKSAVFVFDEVDKVEDFDFLYTILENIFKKSIFLVTNHKDWLLDLDIRIKSRMNPEVLEFRSYDINEVKGILQQRIDYGFVDDTWDESAVELVAVKTVELDDIRSGLYILRESGLAAENKSSKRVTDAHVIDALSKMENFAIKPKNELDDDTQFILELIKKKSGQKIGGLFRKYQDDGGDSVYKTFQRKVRKLADNKFVGVQTVMGGADGTTSIVTYNTTKKLTEF